MSRRSRAREVVLQILYQDDLNPDQDAAVTLRFLWDRLHHDVELVAFASALLEGVRGNRSRLDLLLAERAANWSLARMAVTDRNVLRLGAYEVLFTDAPRRVAINEAVMLARRFGTRQSGAFVNGILDRFCQEGERLNGDGPPGD